jgi:Ran GTPase-activating protein (RanGAP) involved in mRNA processing and transport
MSKLSFQFIQPLSASRSIICLFYCPFKSIMNPFGSECEEDEYHEVVQSAQQVVANSMLIPSSISSLPYFLDIVRLLRLSHNARSLPREKNQEVKKKLEHNLFEYSLEPLDVPPPLHEPVHTKNPVWVPEKSSIWNLSRSFLFKLFSYLPGEFLYWNVARVNRWFCQKIMNPECPIYLRMDKAYPPRVLLTLWHGRVNLCGICVEGIISGIGVEALFPFLRNVSVQVRQLDWQYLRMLWSHLPLCTTMSELNLSKCQIRDDGAKDVAEKLIAKTKWLRNLVLEGNLIGNEGLKHICHALEVNDSIQLLNLNENVFAGTDAMEALEHTLRVNKTVSTLLLVGNDLENAGWSSVLSTILHPSSSVRCLDVEDTHLSPGSLTISESVFPLASPLHTLKLGGNDLGLEDATSLSMMLQSSPKLRVLELFSNSIGPDGCKVISQGIAKNTGLRVLNMEETDIGIQGLTEIVQALCVQGRVEELNIANNGIGSDGASLLCDLVEKCGNRCLRKLDVSKNDLGNEGCMFIFRSLGAHSVLRELQCAGNGVGDAGAEKIAEYLLLDGTQRMGVANLEVLDLSNNCMGPRGGLAIATALRCNRTLKTLSMGSCPLMDEGTSALFDAMRVNRTIERLSLPCMSTFYSHHSHSSSSFLAATNDVGKKNKSQFFVCVASLWNR